MKKIFLIPLIAVFFAACEFLEPEPIQDLTTDQLWSHSTFGEGILTRAYTGLSIGYPVTLDYFTDNAVPQTPGSNIIALGGWTRENSPIGNWGNAYNMIKHLNLFLDNGDDLLYRVVDRRLDSAWKVQRVGEAYFLRAWYTWELLQAYAGRAGGEYLGVPLVTEYLEFDENINLARDTYENTVAQIAEDLDSAVARLPLRYTGSFTNDNVTNIGRANGLATLALKARVYLYAASPAYGAPTQEKWERAAEAAAAAIDSLTGGGIGTLQPYGNFNNVTADDHIWVRANAGLPPAAYFPPSLFGDGIANPSQNLVDAFPAADGYPISTSSVYDPADPYANRDPRFERFIFHNGEVYSATGTTIETFQGGSDAPGGLNQLGTRTGYYLQKLLSNNIILTPGNEADDNDMRVFLGEPELLLNFAEAANNAFGPNDARYGYSAADALRAVRQRAGIDSDPGTAGYQDQYLDDQAAAGQGAFATLVANERRVELCFEGFRFWDMRRYNQPLNHTVRGVEIIDNGGGNYTYNYVNVEDHVFQPHMRYAPIPFTETLLMDALRQNDGW